MGDKYKVTVTRVDATHIVGAYFCKQNPKSKRWDIGASEGYFPFDKITYLRYVNPIAFKKGDTVQCVESKGACIEGLIFGLVYSVKKVEGDKVYVCGIDYPIDAWRFQRIRKTK